MRFKTSFILALLLGLCLSVSFVGARPSSSSQSDTPAPRDTPTPPPTIRFSQYWGDLGRAPIELTYSGTGRDGRVPVQCVNFRNISDKVATSVTFGFAYNDPHGNTLVTESSTYTGSFNAPFEGRQMCSHFRLGSDNVEQIGGVDVHVLRVGFADGSAWITGRSFVRAYGNQFALLPQPQTVPASLPYSLALTTTISALTINQHWADGGQSPIEIVHSDTAYPFGSSMPWQCVNFRNISDKAASDVTFSFAYTNASNVALASQQYDVTGTFTAPAEIDKKCVSFYPGPNDTLSQITNVDMHVRSVLFKDGTQWNAGDPFTHKFTADGTASNPR